MLELRARIARSMAAAVIAAGALAGCGSNSVPNGRFTLQSGGVRLQAAWGQPTRYARPRALLLLIHGGGWVGRDTVGLNFEISIAPLFQRLGYETLALDYRRGALGIRDAKAFYRFARQRVGPKLPICALGPSAGGHIALMLAVQTPDLACVIDFAGPTDLVSLARQPGGAIAYKLALAAFGVAHLAAYSPALRAQTIRAKLMLLYAQTDPLVPVAQGTEMARTAPGVQLLVLPPGPAGFVHSAGDHKGVSVAAKAKAQTDELAFLADVARSWRRP